MSGPKRAKPKYHGGILSAYSEAAQVLLLSMFKKSLIEGINTKKPNIIKRTDNVISDQPVNFLIFNKKDFMSSLALLDL